MKSPPDAGGGADLSAVRRVPEVAVAARLPVGHGRSPADLRSPLPQHRLARPQQLQAHH